MTLPVGLWSHHMDNPIGWFGLDLSKLEGDAEMWPFPMLNGGSRASGALVKMPGFAAGANNMIGLHSMK